MRFSFCIPIFTTAFSFKAPVKPLLQSGAVEQTLDHVILECPIHQPRNGAFGLKILDEKTIE